MFTMSEKVWKITKKVGKLILPVFSFFFLISATAIILVLVNGYSIDIRKRALIETGVLSIESVPNDARILINNEASGNTNKVISNIKTGRYQLNIEKDGYYPYTKMVDVDHSLAVNVYANLILNSPSVPVYSLKENEEFVINSDYYLLRKILSSGSSASLENSYELIKLIPSRILFDTPKVNFDDKMQITLPEGYVLNSIIPSKNGKFILIKGATKDNKGFADIIQYRKGSDYKVTLSHSSLSYYFSQKDTKISWTDSNDYLLIETSTQIISYNQRTKARIILLEKEESDSIWSEFTEGIATLIISPNQDKNKPLEKVYDLALISFNGNSIDSKITSISLTEPPLFLKVERLNNKTYMVISQKSGSVLIGELYLSQPSDLEISGVSEKLENVPITKIDEDVQQIPISELPVKSVIFDVGNFQIFFSGTEETEITSFSFNRRLGDTNRFLGTKSLFETNTKEKVELLIYNKYLFFISQKTLYAVDSDASNLYTIASDTTEPVFELNDSVVLFTNTQKELHMRILR